MFHVLIMPPVKFKSWLGFALSVISSEPLRVVIASGSYHSMLFVCGAVVRAESARKFMVRTYDPVVQVDGLPAKGSKYRKLLWGGRDVPVWVITGVKCTSVLVELVTEHELELGSVLV